MSYVEKHKGKTNDQIQAEMSVIKANFIAEYAKCANIAKAARAAGTDRRQIHRWLEHDEEFIYSFNEAKEDAIEALEEEARRRAADGTLQVKPIYYKGEEVGSYEVREYSDTLLVFLLKALRPEKYKDRMDLTTTTIVKAYSGVDVDSV